MSHYIDGAYFDLLECGQCGIKFLAPTHWTECRRDRGDHEKKFYCPNGHCRVWGTSTIDTIRQERDRLKQRIAEKDDEIAAKVREVTTVKKKIRTMEKRASAGTCPCCQRPFSNMATHMRKQHPAFVEATKSHLKVVA